jgi:MFS family permease
LLILQAILGLLAGGSVAIVQTIGGMVMPEAVRGAGFGFFASAMMLGRAVSPILSGTLGAFSLRAVFVVDGMLYALLTLWAFFAKGVPRRPSHEP